MERKPQHPLYDRYPQWKVEVDPKKVNCRRRIEDIQEERKRKENER